MPKFGDLDRRARRTVAGSAMVLMAALSLVVAPGASGREALTQGACHAAQLKGLTLGVTVLSQPTLRRLGGLCNSTRPADTESLVINAGQTVRQDFFLNVP